MIDDSIQQTGDQFEEIPSIQIEDALPAANKIKIRPEPRMSAKQLAEYLVSEQSRQKAIIKEAKFPRTIPMVSYKKVRTAIPRAFSASCLDIAVLSERADAIELENNQEGVSQWHQNDNTNSASAIRLLCGIAPRLSWKNARIVALKFPPLKIAGVIISVSPDLIFSFEDKGIKKIGGLILNTAQGEQSSLSRASGGNNMGTYLALLLFRMLFAHSSKVGAPLNSKCFAVDIFRQGIYTAPNSYLRLNKNIEAACEVIALRWPTINLEITPRHQAVQNIPS